MARTLPAGMATDLATDGTAPRWLLELQFQTPLYLHSGSTNVTANNYAGAENTFVANEFRVTGLRKIDGGDIACDVEFPNDDNSMSSTILTQPTTREVQMYLWYVEGANRLLEFDGFVAEYPRLYTTVQISASSRSFRYEYTPRLTIAPHIFNHLTPSGTVIEWGQRKFILRRADES